MIEPQTDPATEQPIVADVEGRDAALANLPPFAADRAAYRLRLLNAEFSQVSRSEIRHLNFYRAYWSAAVAARLNQITCLTLHIANAAKYTDIIGRL